MKLINKFISEGLTINKNTKFKRSKPNDIDYSEYNFSWNCNHISKEDLLRICNNALHTKKLYASDILKEINKYDDIDDLNDAYEDGYIPTYKKFEEEVSCILNNNDKYEGWDMDIMTEMFKNIWAIMDILYKINS